VRVQLTGGDFGWLLQDGPNLRRDIRYMLPPPGSSHSPWGSPLPSGVTMLGAYGEPLGTPQWALRGGTDVRGQPGDRVQAAAEGVVIFTGYSVRWARYYVVVRHDGTWEGWQTAYMGLQGTGKQGIQVHDGQTVRRGQLLGYLAPGAYQQPTSLHFVVQTPDGTPIESQNVLQWP
jgi:murein DD-endopeptidase MepM/ murein hydrolase activator NlpD